MYWRWDRSVHRCSYLSLSSRSTSDTPLYDLNCVRRLPSARRPSHAFRCSSCLSFSPVAFIHIAVDTFHPQAYNNSNSFLVTPSVASSTHSPTLVSVAPLRFFVQLVHPLTPTHCVQVAATHSSDDPREDNDITFLIFYSLCLLP